jgi:acyl carrier protein
MLKQNKYFSDFQQEIYDFILAHVGMSAEAVRDRETRLIDLRLDSLSLVELQMLLEDHFALSFSLEGINSDTSLKQLIFSLQPINEK